MFVVILSAVLGLMSLYVWKRLVKDTTRRGRIRRVLTAVHVALTVLLAATLILPRVAGVTESWWFAWPGYFWFGMVARTVAMPVAGSTVFSIIVTWPVSLALLPGITAISEAVSPAIATRTSGRLRCGTVKET